MDAEADSTAAGGALALRARTSPPRQNRVTPFGEIVRTPARGTLMGNRGGCLHDERQELVAARWRSRRWIACLLEFKGRHRAIMSPHRYTELFFLDEVTALAAGHRPCAECRRRDFNEFKQAWLDGNPAAGLRLRDSIDEIDKHLHRERTGQSRGRPSGPVTAGSLPDGVFVRLSDTAADAYLVWEGGLHCWSFDGYAEPVDLVPDREVYVITPPSIVATIRAGYHPGTHPSLGQHS